MTPNTPNSLEVSFCKKEAKRARAAGLAQLSTRKTIGFTLLELIVAVAIISLLSSIVLASLGGARSSARDARRQQDMRQLEQALQQYTIRFGEYPAADDGSGRCKLGNGMKDELQPLLDEGILTSIPCDPQIDGDDVQQYHYFSPGSKAWWASSYTEHCGKKPTDNLEYFLLYSPENTVEEVPFSKDGPVSGNTCGPGSGNSQRCCVHSG